MERYGEKPKRFTREWFEYVWEYYKIHIIVTILVIAAVVYTWVSIATRPYYDLYVCFAGEAFLEDSAKEALSMELKNYAEDVNGDGKVQVKILDYSVPDSFDDQQYAQTMDTKLYLEFQAGDAYVFVMPKEKADKLIEDEALNGVFEETSEWGAADGDNKYFAAAGENGVLKKCGISDFYIGVRNDMSRNDEGRQQYENAEVAAKAMMG